MASAVSPSNRQYNRARPQPFVRAGQRRPNQRYGTFLVRLVGSGRGGQQQRIIRSKSRETELEDISEKATIENTDDKSKMPGKTAGRRSRSPRTPRTPRSSTRSPYEANVFSAYDSRLDAHQQSYVLSPVTLEALRRTMKSTHHRVFSDPNKKIGLHGPRTPLLLSYPTKPTKAGRAVFVHRPPSAPGTPRSMSVEPESVAPPPVLMVEENIPDTDEARDFVRLVHHLRTGATRIDNPIPKKLRRPKTVAPPQTKAQRLAKEKGFILDGVALSSIQDDYSKVQPKLGPAIPPYNSHFDKQVTNYFRFQGLGKNLRKTGQTKGKSESLQGKAVDRFHYIGDGHIYMQKRNRSGAGYSRDLVDGHDQFLAEARPMNGYNGRFGFRRNTPTLRKCPSPFGTASRSPTF